MTQTKHQALLDDFAGQAMRTLLTTRDYPSLETVARDAYKVARAMMAERDQEEHTLPTFLPDRHEGIEKLFLSTRTVNLLHREEIYTIEDLLAKSRVELLKSVNIGKKSLTEIEDRVVFYGGLRNSGR